MTWRKEDREGQETPLKYHFDCHESYAGYTEYNQGKTALLILNGEAEWLEGPDAGKRQEHHLWLSVGEQFKPSADGKRIEHKKGDANKRMDPNAKAQRFINSCFKASPPVPLEDLGTDSLDATMFAGHGFTIEVEKKTGKIDGEERRLFQPLVTAYRGPLGGAQPASTNGAAADEQKDAIAALAKEMKAAGNDDLDFSEKAHTQFGLPIDSPVLADAWSKA